MRILFTTLLLSFIFAVYPNTNINAQTKTIDNLSNFDYLFEKTNNISIDTGIPANFNNDSSRIVRSDIQNGHVIYAIRNISAVSVDFWGVDGDPNDGIVKVFASSDGVTYVQLTLQNEILDETSSLRYLKRYQNANALWNGINFIKIELSGGDASWKAQLSKIEITNTIFSNSVATDSLNNFENVISYSNLIIDNNNTSSFNNDMSRAVRVNTDSASLVYQNSSDMLNLEVDFWGVTGDTGSGDISVYISSNGVDYQKTVLTTSVYISYGYRDLSTFTTVNDLPLNTKYIKVVLSEGNAAWKGHLGSVRIKTQRASKNFYLSNNGNDSDAGTENKPWKTLAKISATSLGAGDSVFFKKGDRFDGHFVVNGSGMQDAPLVITSYGTGNLPIITGEVGEENGGDYQEAILVENNDNIEISNLEINNERSASREGILDDDAYGILIINTGSQSMNNFVIRNVKFQNVYAAKAVLKEEGEDAFNNLEVAALRFYSTKNTTIGQEKNINNILVEDSYFTDLQRLGIHIKHQGGDTGVGNDSINSNMNCVVRNNEFHFIGGTCVLPIRTYNALIEDNLFNHPGASIDDRMPGRGSSVWNWRCFNTVIQYNKCLSTRGYLDSHGIHIDHENVNTFIQYNYMEDCEGGFVEILGGNHNSVYRFNVSVNDGWRENPSWANSNHTIWINEVAPSGTHYSDENYIYNNTVFMDSAYSTSIDIDGKSTHIFNNIFYAAEGNIGGKRVSINTNGETFFMSNNLFAGGINGQFSNLDVDKVWGDPAFLAEGVLSKYGYQLQEGSPAINSGTTKVGPAIPGAGYGIFKDLTPYPTVDYYGNGINLFDGTPNIGACNAKNGEFVDDISLTPQEISIDSSLVTIAAGDTQILNATILPTAHTIIWTSDNQAVATVDQNGLVTAIAGGKAIISAATEGGHISTSCDVIVTSALPLTVPSNVVITAFNQSAKVEWVEGQNATTHKIQYKKDGYAWQTISDIYNDNSDEYWLSNLEEGTDYTVRIRAYNTAYASAWSELASFTTNSSNSRVLAVDDTDLKFSFAPNPAEHQLYFKGLLAPTPVLVIDINGRVILEEEVKHSLNIQNLRSGVYILKVEGHRAMRFIKK
ncbi:Ig-like domain-containing protein [Flammeovirga kamogawensis]|uniref:Ig-like domain-containing protein n=1 Tax=Flammeovirga kamogawensis TaxID=373891 RepID=A0ABX8H4V4_9BACT|nr:Ig-like domain-containing protein [Flammeovirga kamogawensis]MBB6461829.1 hypothetical protein [Flammeovirga kamogawensis]QWG10744.1 Ig-like domain-containing protein [Flammeovirga kamogawensis]TRX63846.1 T9SS type A sorting domain-containing protein [Flammeovirga kamogawensis]